jgi:competence protein ComEA
MMLRVALVAAALILAAYMLWHPARAPVVQSAAATASPLPDRGLSGARHHRSDPRPADYASDGAIVYVAGAVRKPGLYRLHLGDRDAKAIALAGGMSPSADAGSVNLAQHAQDGDEIYVPVAGEVRHSGATRYPSASSRRNRRHARLPAEESVDVNRSSAAELAAVPGIGRAIAQRIVDLRAREGGFASLDELLDVAGMTSARLERARPYLHQP